MKHPILVMVLSGITIAAMYGFNAYMMHLGDVYVASGKAISDPVLILFGISGFLYRFRWILPYPIFGFFIIFTELLPFSKRSKSGA